MPAEPVLHLPRAQRLLSRNRLFPRVGRCRIPLLSMPKGVRPSADAMHQSREISVVDGPVSRPPAARSNAPAAPAIKQLVGIRYKPRSLTPSDAADQRTCSSWRTRGRLARLRQVGLILAARDDGGSGLRKIFWR
jgi:hypothetical protein